MAATEKILWVVNYDALGRFLDQAKSVGATGVAIRTDNDVAKAITAGHDQGLKVFGWRWPSAARDPAMKEADAAADLLAKGLDGYFVDPEGAKGKPWDWDRAGLAELADAFCRRITEAAPGKPFGVTSHYRAAAVFPDLPWRTFFQYASVLLPQAYWRSSEGTIGHGIPGDNYLVALDFWGQAGGDRHKIVPMAGELASSKASEIAAHAAAAAGQGVATLHFYTYEPSVTPAVWAAIKAA